MNWLYLFRLLGFFLTLLASLLALSPASYELTTTCALAGTVIVALTLLTPSQGAALLALLVFLSLARYVTLPWPTEWAPLARLTCTAAVWIVVASGVLFLVKKAEEILRGRIVNKRNNKTYTNTR